uniref:hypothetical protein n=1 Tax=uncultured Rikenella sp. TaxID=368003 RepID=UPI00260D8AC2
GPPRPEREEKKKLYPRRGNAHRPEAIIKEKSLCGMSGEVKKVPARQEGNEEKALPARDG